MNKQQEINDLLDKFRKKCGIENDCGDLVGNLKAELQEAVDATDSAHKAEEFADIYIIAANAFAQLECVRDCDFYVKPIIMTDVKYFLELDFTGLELELLSRTPDASSDLFNIKGASMEAIKLLGYNPESVILEKCKLINTRTGKMNEAGTKWCKDKNQDPATLYKMDVEGCLL